MDFTLHYRGPLYAASKRNSRKEHKHQLRQHFHKQLKELWDLPQLEDAKNYLRAEPAQEGDIAILQPVGPFEFAPLVTTQLRLFASIEIVMLRPEPDGRIFDRGGDIDNRLKTLLDALKVPNEEALPHGVSPSPDESPFFCLLEDDSLVTNIDIKTAHWLEPEVQDSEVVVLLLRIRTSPTVLIWGNLLFA
jgi:hypothetical protein